MKDLLSNYILWGALLTSVIAQLIKFVSVAIRTGKFDLSRLVGTGGMPSAHSASVMALTTMVGLKEGFGSPLFGVVAFFSLITMYDAAGVRKAAGEQARVLNVILDEMMKGHPVSQVELKELLGHTPKEVLTGALMGILFGVLFHMLWG
ncbi:MAG: divergent PAP2 family protein [Thermotogae bacterium]|nr:divergent PAP2 family protein [Thermotogota bacterium]